MANVNNVNGQSMVNSKEVRDSQLAALESKLQDLRESHIWESTGGKFETVFRDYMTSKQVAAFFNLTWDEENSRCVTLTNYIKQDSDHYGELINSGFKKFSKSELESMVSEFQKRVEDAFENDSTNSLIINNRGMVLWHLKSVIKLGMFMTKTESAKLFRDAIIEMLSAQVTVAKAYQSTVQGYLQQMELSAQQGHIFETSILTNIMNDLRAASKVCYKQDILNTIDTLSDVTMTYNKLLMQTNMFEDQLYYSQIKSALEQLTISINVLQQTIIKLDGVRLEANTKKELYNRTEVIKDAVLQKTGESDRDYNLRINQLTNILAIAGYITIEEDYQRPQRDSEGKRIVIDDNNPNSDPEKGIFYDTAGNKHIGSKFFRYKEGKRKNTQWIFNNEYVMNRDTKQQILKYTPVGRSLWGALYRQADVVYDKLVQKYTDPKTGNLNTVKLKDYIKNGKSKEWLVKACVRKINLTKEEFEAQYAYAVLNNDPNTIILL